MFKAAVARQTCSQLVPTTYTKQLEFLHRFFAFKIPHVVVPTEDITVEKFNEVAALWRPTLPYDTDGVVVRSEH
jgi:NAD-dependent DNA ligase